jgi:hypothetical protein
VPSPSGSSSLKQLSWIYRVYYIGTGDEGNEGTVSDKPNGDAVIDTGWDLGGPAGMGD